MIKSRRKTSWALVGLGTHGRRLAQAIKASKHASLIAVVGKNDERAKKFAEEFGVPHYYSSLAEALADPGIDAVCIATQNDMHAADAIRALRAGKDVLCEKPLALTLRDGMSILRESKRRRKKCLVDFQLRQNPAVQYARALIARNALGKIRYIEMAWSIGSFGEEKLSPLPPHMRWRENIKQAGGGALVARGVHLFDLLRFLTGEEVAGVRAYTDATRRTVDRTAIGILTLASGAPAVIATSKQIPAAQNRIVIYGQNGNISLDIFEKENVMTYLSSKKIVKKKFPVVNLYTAVFDAYYDPSSKNMNATALDGVRAIEIAEAFKL